MKAFNGTKLRAHVDAIRNTRGRAKSQHNPTQPNTAQHRSTHAHAPRCAERAVLVFARSRHHHPSARSLLRSQLCAMYRSMAPDR